MRFGGCAREGGIMGVMVHGLCHMCKHPSQCIQSPSRSRLCPSPARFVCSVTLPSRKLPFKDLGQSRAMPKLGRIRQVYGLSSCEFVDFILATALGFAPGRVGQDRTGPTFCDPMFVKNWSEFPSHALHVGVYRYSWPPVLTTGCFFSPSG